MMHQPVHTYSTSHGKSCNLDLDNVFIVYKVGLEHGVSCLNFSFLDAIFRHEKSKAQTNSKFLAQLSKSQKLKKAEFICKAEKLSFLSFFCSFFSPEN